MKRIYLFLLIVTFSVLPSIAASYSAKIEKIWLEHNVMKDGEQNLVIHLKMQSFGLKGKKGNIVAYVDIPQGVGHKDTNNRYHTTDKNVCTSTEWSTSYDNSVWEDLKLYLPNSEIHPLSGKHTYYIRAIFWYGNEQLASSEYVAFDMTGNGPAAQQTPQNNRQSAVQQNSNNNGTYKRNVTSNSYEVCVEHENYISVTRYITCPKCKGVGKELCPIVHSYPMFCLACNNTGYIKCSCGNGVIRIGYWSEPKQSVYQLALEAKNWAKSQKKTDKVVALDYQDNGDAYFTFSASYTNGVSVFKTCKPCTSCLSNGICGSCNGEGYNHRYSVYIPSMCESCNGRGKCSMCLGSKYLLIESTTDKYGKGMRKIGGNITDGNSRSSSSSSNDPSKPTAGKPCTRCGQTGTIIIPAYHSILIDDNETWFCVICRKNLYYRDYHRHIKCSTCKGDGIIDPGD